MKARLKPVPGRAGDHEGHHRLEKVIVESGIEPSLIELVKTRASQINGCAFCIHMHTRDARAHGETEERLYLAERLARIPALHPRRSARLWPGPKR